MQHPEFLKREIKAIAFDQYGTIVDMQAGLVAAVTPFLRQKGWQGEPNSFVTWWRRTHFESSMIDALCDRGAVRAEPRELGGRLHQRREVAGRGVDVGGVRGVGRDAFGAESVVKRSDQ